MDDAAAGWKADPTGRHEHRYWDGAAWTELVADAGASGRDPVDPRGLAVSGAVPGTASDAYTGWAPRTDEPQPTPRPNPAGPAPDRAPLGSPGPRPASTSSPSPSWSPAPSTGPTSSPAPAATPSPEPSVPTAPSPGRQQPGGGGVRIDRRVVLVAGAALLVVVLGFVLLRGGGGGGRSETVDRLVVVLREGGLSAEQAKCAADVIVDRVGTDELSQIEDLTQMPSDLSPEFVEEFTAAQEDAIEACDVTPPGAAG